MAVTRPSTPEDVSTETNKVPGDFGEFTVIKVKDMTLPVPQDVALVIGDPADLKIVSVPLDWAMGIRPFVDSDKEVRYMVLCHALEANKPSI